MRTEVIVKAIDQCMSCGALFESHVLFTGLFLRLSRIDPIVPALNSLETTVAVANTNHDCIAKLSLAIEKDQKTPKPDTV